MEARGWLSGHSWVRRRKWEWKIEHIFSVKTDDIGVEVLKPARYTEPMNQICRTQFSHPVLHSTSWRHGRGRPLRRSRVRCRKWEGKIEHTFSGETDDDDDVEVLKPRGKFSKGFLLNAFLHLSSASTAMTATAAVVDVHHYTSPNFSCDLYTDKYIPISNISCWQMH